MSRRWWTSDAKFRINVVRHCRICPWYLDVRWIIVTSTCQHWSFLICFKMNKIHVYCQNKIELSWFFKKASYRRWVSNGPTLAIDPLLPFNLQYGISCYPIGAVAAETPMLMGGRWRKNWGYSGSLGLFYCLWTTLLLFLNHLSISVPFFFFLGILWKGTSTLPSPASTACVYGWLLLTYSNFKCAWCSITSIIFSCTRYCCLTNGESMGWCRITCHLDSVVNVVRAWWSSPRLLLCIINDISWAG